jgi:GMP synthase-like glutamine amidotransferase
VVGAGGGPTLRPVRALVISHDPSERPALVGARLEEHGFELDVFVVCDDSGEAVSHRPFPSLDGVDVLVAMGSPWSVYDDEIGSWIGREIDLVREAHRRAVPYLGVCFGGQVLAAALGASVERAPRPELGWCTVETTAPDAVDEGPWFQWHGDRFTLPAGATELARNDVGVQAFRMGRSVAVQFHPEVDLELLSSWIGDGEPLDPLFEQLGVEPTALLTSTAELAARATANTNRLVDWFLA